jgi:hypothetical protein
MSVEMLQNLFNMSEFNQELLMVGARGRGGMYQGTAFKQVTHDGCGRGLNVNDLRKLVSTDPHRTLRHSVMGLEGSDTSSSFKHAEAILHNKLVVGLLNRMSSHTEAVAEKHYYIREPLADGKLWRTVYSLDGLFDEFMQLAPFPAPTDDLLPSDIAPLAVPLAAVVAALQANPPAALSSLVVCRSFVEAVEAHQQAAGGGSIKWGDVLEDLDDDVTVAYYKHVHVAVPFLPKRSSRKYQGRGRGKEKQQVTGKRRELLRGAFKRARQRVADAEDAEQGEGEERVDVDGKSASEPDAAQGTVEAATGERHLQQQQQQQQQQ